MYFRRIHPTTKAHRRNGTLAFLLSTLLLGTASSVVAGTGAQAASATVVIDQSTGKTFGGIFNADSTFITWQQESLVGAGGKLMGIDILPQRGSFNPPMEATRFFVNVGSPWQSDPHDFETTISVPVQTGDDWFYIDVSAANIFLDVGDTFVWGTNGINGGLWLHGHHQLQYPAALWTDSPPFGIREHETLGRHSDLAFRSHVLVIPEPGTLTLLACATLAGLIWWRRRR